MAGKDKELTAISSIIELLNPLDPTERGRVLEYVLKRLEMDTVRAGPTIASELGTSSGLSSAGPMITDIRSLTAEKQPRSANEMVALIAYYLSELAPENDRLQTVNVDTIRRYFKMAAFPMPRSPKNALTNASAAGYLENASRGEYRLNPVGYNLVVHGLPRASSPKPSGAARKNVHSGALRTIGARWSGKMPGSGGRLPVVSRIARVKATIVACPLVSE
jgi:hypothetical protein